MEKFFKSGWAFAFIFGLALCIVTILYTIERRKELPTNSTPEKVEVISQDSLFRSMLPTFFYDHSFEMGLCEAPVEFPVINNEDENIDGGITATPKGFANYFKKHYCKDTCDQVIITAVKAPELGQLRWHIRMHKKQPPKINGGNGV